MSVVADKDNPAKANLIYVLYLIGAFFLIPIFIGAAYAFLYKDAGETYVRSHYDFQFEMFWKLGVYMFASLLLLPIYFLGVLMLVFIYGWWIYRCFKGMRLLDQGYPIENPKSWLFGG